jgi:hypothetical protein
MYFSSGVSISAKPFPSELISTISRPEVRQKIIAIVAREVTTWLSLQV